MESELKFECTKEFIKNIETTKEEIFRPRIILGIPGCVGSGRDSNQVNAAIRIRFSTIVLNTTQCMGRCGRSDKK